MCACPREIAAALAAEIKAEPEAAAAVAGGVAIVTRILFCRLCVGLPDFTFPENTLT
jgi:hypothetical protein